MQSEMVQTPKRKKKWMITGIIASVALVAGINIAVMQSKKNDAAEDLKFTSVQERTLSNTKLVSGQVAPGNMEAFYADAAKGKVKDIFVQEGEEVQQGQKLFSYENTELSLQMQQLELEKKIAAMRYEQGKEKIKSLKNDIKKAKDADADDTVLQPLEAQLKEAEFQQKTADLENEKIQLQIQELQKKQNDLTVYSKSGGIVQALDKEAAQSNVVLGQAKPIMQIASKDPFQIKGTLTELQKAQIQKDQTVKVTAKAVPNKTWTGKIIEVSEYPAANENSQAASMQGQQMISYYSYTASLDSQDGLAPGYHVSLQVNLSSQKIVAVPRSSIVEEDDSSYVFIKDGKQLDKRKVTTGMGDGEWVEVLEGVKQGDKVVKNPSSKLRDGMDVTGK
ncbi:MAG: efflux RND transporter periplasmic adaptor subunit [Ectobacillus sp.]